MVGDPDSGVSSKAEVKNSIFRFLSLKTFPFATFLKNEFSAFRVDRCSQTNQEVSMVIVNAMYAKFAPEREEFGICLISWKLLPLSKLLFVCLCYAFERKLYTPIR